MKWAVLVLLLSAGPALAEDDWMDGEVDDIECMAQVGDYTVVYTYNSAHTPKSIPEGLMCFMRDYERQASTFAKSTELFYKHFGEGKLQ